MYELTERAVTLASFLQYLLLNSFQEAWAWYVTGSWHLCGKQGKGEK